MIPDFQSIIAEMVVRIARARATFTSPICSRTEDVHKATIAIAAGKIRPLEPRYFFYMIWATTQHYADFEDQIRALNGGAPLTDEQFQKAKAQVVDTILRGVTPL